MGCWNGTCIISNLPITHGDRIKLLFLYGTNLVPDTGWNSPIGSCHPDGVWSVMPSVISGKYNDYGSIEEVDENIFTKTTLKIFQTLFKSGSIKIELDRGEESVEFKTIEEFTKLVERGRVTIARSYGPKEYVQLAFCMAREDVWNSICKEYVPDMWVKDRPLPGIDQFAHRVEVRQGLEYALMAARDESRGMDFKSLMDKKRKKAGLKPRKYFLSKFDEEADKVLAKLSKKTRDKLIAEQNGLWKIYDIMHSLRTGFAPAFGTGSQDTDFELHAALANIALDICKKELARND